MERRRQAGGPGVLGRRRFGSSASTPRISGCSTITAFKYALDFAPAQRVRGDLLNGHLQLRTVRDLGFPARRGPARRPVRPRVPARPARRHGGLQVRRPHRVAVPHRRRGPGARALAEPRPDPRARRARASATPRPWGVPAFFLAGGSRGDLGWNRFGETRLQLDATYGGIRRVDLFVGGQYVAQQVRTYQRVLRLPARRDDTVPPPAVSAFSPRSAAGYVEAQTRVADLGITAGLRYDRVRRRGPRRRRSRAARRASLSPRFAVSTVLSGATFVASYGRSPSRPTTSSWWTPPSTTPPAPGGFAAATPTSASSTPPSTSSACGSARARRCRSGWVSTTSGSTGWWPRFPLGINPDSTIFGNADAGTTRGPRVLAERELRNGFGFRLAYTLQSAKATSTDPFLLNRLIVVDPQTGDTIRPARAEFPLDFDQRHTLTVIARGKAPDRHGPRSSACGRSRARGGGDRPGAVGPAVFAAPTRSAPTRSSGLPNSSAAALARRPWTCWSGGRSGWGERWAGSISTAEPAQPTERRRGPAGHWRARSADDAAIARLAEAAYAAHPEAIPYESSRYRRSPT